MAKARGGLKSIVAVVAGLALLAAGCGSDDAATETGGTAQSEGRPTIVVTTNILGDVVSEVVGDQAEVVFGKPFHLREASGDQLKGLSSLSKLTELEVGDRDVVMDSRPFEAIVTRADEVS